MLSSKDIEWIYTQYPGLKIDIKNKCIIGDIFLNRSYKKVTLTNFFKVKIKLEILPGLLLPKVYEISGKIKEIADYLRLSNIEDAHVNSDNSLCLAIYGRENECFTDKFNIREFLENCLEPYLYWISYYEKYRKKPWDDYYHGHLGIIEMYAENRLNFKKLRKKIPLKLISKYLYHYDYKKNVCLCGSNIDMKKCHNDIYRGLKKIKNDFSLLRKKQNKLSVFA